ncbi:MAG: efflux RND transporter permease subunit [Gammaproteobacteria bacterium]
MLGQRRFAIRVWLDRKALAARNLTVDDIINALRRNNIELPAGELTSSTRQFTVRTDTRLSSVQQFANVVVSNVDGYPIRLGDVARVVRGVEDDQTMVRSDGKNAVGLSVIRQSQSNTVSISDRIRAQLERLRPTLPEGMSIDISSDDAIFIKASIREVLQTLAIAVAVVISVILLFLASFRAALVPAVTIPVAVIGSFIGIYALGFSLNILTMLALILAIGLVVDDAIVVLENIQRRIALGEPPLVAGYLGTRQVTFAVLATSAVLIAVFVPLSFLQGEVGRLFTEFGLVLAVTVIISTFVALTLCAMLCTKVLRANASEHGPSAWLEHGFNALARGYHWLLAGALQAPLVVLMLGALTAGSAYWLYAEVPQELTPKEDRGVFFFPVTAPLGANAATTDSQVRQVEALAQPLLDSGEAVRLFALVGRGGRSNSGFVVVRLTEWEQRERSQQEIINELIPRMSSIIGARAFPISPSALGGRGSSTPLQVVIGGPDYATIQDWADEFIEQAGENPNLLNLEVDFEQNQPQFNVLVDRAKADDLGIGIDTIGRALQTMLAGQDATQYVDRGREYPVILQAEAQDRRSPSDLSNIFVRAGNGDLTPLSALVHLTESAAAPSLRRFNRLPSITISGSLADGYDLGEAIRYVQALTAEILPAEASIGFAGESQKFLDTSAGVALTFTLALLIVFLVLAAQFESFIHPLIIMLTVPLALTGALLSLWLSGNSLNIYSQIGIILLIGLTTKNGILIVEFANQLRAEGHSIRSAILEGASLRLRPVLMTVISTVFGAVPLALASGAGAESRAGIGIVVVGGLGLASLLTLFVVPVLYDLLARFARPANAIEQQLEQAMADIAQRADNADRAASASPTTRVLPDNALPHS